GSDARGGESTAVAARGHGADEHVAVPGVGLHAHAIAQDRPTRDRAARIDRDHGNGAAAPTDLADERRDESALARARRPGDADQLGMTGEWIERADGSLPRGTAVLYLGEDPCQCPAVPATRPLGKLGLRRLRGVLRRSLAGHPQAARRALVRRYSATSLIVVPGPKTREMPADSSAGM